MKKVNTIDIKDIKKNNEIYTTVTQIDKEKVFELFNTTQVGLTEEGVEIARETYGSNVIDYGKKETIIHKLGKAFITPFSVVLILLAAVSFITDYLLAPPMEKDITAVVIIVVMVALSGIISFVQSIQSSNAAEKLADMVEVTTAVIRAETKQTEIPIDEVVCGDIIRLAAGDMIPADIRILRAKDLFVAQSAMTGESEPVERIGLSETDLTKSVTEYQNMVYMGSTVISGTAEGVVVATGNQTLFGRIAKDVTVERVKTSFEMGISSVSWLLIRFMAIMVPAVFFINGFTKGSWIDAFLFGISVAVGLTPEMLPMIVNSNLIKGANEMAKKGTIIKNLNSIQNFGAIDILCTDKTGTLTQDKIILEYHLDMNGDEDDRVLRHAFFNSYYQTGLRNLMDVSIIEVADETLNLKIDQYEKVDEIPFDFKRRRMSVVIKDRTNNKTQLITKGAVEEMLSISKYVDYQGKIIELTDEVKQSIIEKVDDLNSDGLRVVAVAQRTNPPAVDEFSVDDEHDMVLIGYLAFLDPPKETTKPALEALAEHNVRVKVLTGDNEMVTRAVCRQVGIDAEEAVIGSQLEGLSFEELRVLVEEQDVFVKLSPQQKVDVVTALRANGHVVGFMGDGINDAPAMKASDVGISVDTAVDIAKESADVILLEKDLMVLETGIVYGRKVFCNIIKYVKMTASSNFGNMFSVLVASIFLPFLPMLPIQLLFLNLIYDISCISIPWDNVDEEYLKNPRKWEADSIKSFMIWNGPISSIFDITTYLLMFFVICPALLGGAYGTLTRDNQLIFEAYFHAGWFIESLWTQTLVIHVLRTPKLPFIKSRASFTVATITTLGILVGTIIPYTNFGGKLGMLPLPSNYFMWLALTIIAYFTLVTVVKNLYIKKHGELL